MRERQVLVAPPKQQGISVRGHAGLVVNNPAASSATNTRSMLQYIPGAKPETRPASTDTPTRFLRSTSPFAVHVGDPPATISRLVSALHQMPARLDVPLLRSPRSPPGGGTGRTRRNCTPRTCSSACTPTCHASVDRDYQEQPSTLMIGNREGPLSLNICGSPEFMAAWARDALGTRGYLPTSEAHISWTHACFFEPLATARTTFVKRSPGMMPAQQTSQTPARRASILSVRDT